jgi:hypothetical protein
MNWTRIFWMTVGGLMLVTLVSGCCAPGDHCLPDGYSATWGLDWKHVTQIGN